MRSRWGFSFWGTSHAAMGVFQVSSLFASGEPGFWFDPSDLSTLFQDTAGTTPVTAAGQSVGLVLDKSRGLVLGPELFTPAGATAFNANGTISIVGNTATVTCTVAGTYGIRFANVAPSAVGRSFRVGSNILTNSATRTVFVDMGGKTSGFGSTTGNKSSHIIDAVSLASVVVYVVGGQVGETFSLDLSTFSVRELPGNHATQSASLSRPTYQIDSNGRGHLLFDGSDDFLITPTITPGTDKAQVFAGVRKLSDAAREMLVEWGNAVPTGKFAIEAPNTAAQPNYYWITSGSLNGVASYTNAAVAAPTTNVLTGIGEIPTDTAILRVNGAQAATSTGDQGTGNYSAQPCYIGRRGGVALPFNGRIYSIICRFGANLTADQIAQTEAWVNSKTGAY